MKVLVIGGNRFVGLRLCTELDRDRNCDLHVLNRTGQAPHLKRATIFKGDRRNMALAQLDQSWDIVVDFANFNDIDTKSSLTHFKHVGRYIFISTASVYDAGPNRKEETFNAAKWDLGQPPNLESPYQDGKRRAEALFARQNQFPVLSVRFPFILGPDDYTRRLKFHVERIEKLQTLFVPNMAARVSMIHAEDACAFLKWSLDKTFTGPLNVAGASAISMAQLMHEIEARVGQKALFVQGPTPQNRSPYGTSEDCFLNCELAAKLGFQARPITEWIGELIDGAREVPPPKVLH